MIVTRIEALTELPLYDAVAVRLRNPADAPAVSPTVDPVVAFRLPRELFVFHT